MDGYRIRLDVYDGPLDLLLHLIQRHELDVRDIPVAQVAQQFADYLDALREVGLDLEEAGEFLVLASELLQLKSELLLPQKEATPATQASAKPTADPRRELVKRLLEYRQIKEAAAKLEVRAAEESRRLPRAVPAEPSVPGGPPPLQPAELWDLVSAFTRLMRETLANAPQQVVADETPQHVYMEQIRQRLAGVDRLAFRELFTPPFFRARLVSLFLALLELVKSRDVGVEQEGPFGDIWLSQVHHEKHE